MYPQYGFGPGAVPNQQARLAALQQYQMQQQIQQQYPQQMDPVVQPVSNQIFGRLVGSPEEAKVAPVPVDGNNFYFPCPSAHKIFVKSMDLNGNAIFESYVKENEAEPKPAYAEASALEALQKRVLELENKLKGEKQDV